MSWWPRHTSSTLPLGTFQPAPWRHLLGLPAPYFRLPAHLARSHFHVIGTSGSGKSRFLATLYLALLQTGASATLIDPQGDLADLVLAQLVARGMYSGTDETPYQRLLYLDLRAGAEQRRYLPFNVLARKGADDAIAAQVKEAFHRAWPELAQGAATFDTLLPDAVLLLLHHGLPLTAMRRLLVDQSFREGLLATETDTELVSSFRDVFDQLRKADQVAYAGSVLRRARQLTQVDVLRYGVGQQEMLIDFARLMAANQSVVINLDLENPDARKLIGCFLTVAAEQGARARGAIPASQRTGTHYLVIDEFSEFAATSSEALARMLSQTRKYGLFVVMAHQTWDQASQRLQSGLQNVGVRVVFNLDRADAKLTAPAIGRVDPTTIKHEVASEAAQERSHPVYESLDEQWEKWVQAIQDLKTGGSGRPGELFIRLRNQPTIKLTALPMPDPVVDVGKLAEVKTEYLHRYFRTKAAVETQLRQHTEPPLVNAPRRRVPSPARGGDPMYERT
jgi:ABC-type cobalamin transport system ATPase subunit